MPKLVQRAGQPDETVFWLRGSAVVIGRAPECEISIAHKSLSRKHAQIENVDGQWFFQDLGSKNGSFVNEERAGRAALLPGDRIQIGELRFQFIADGPSSNVASEAVAPHSVNDPVPQVAFSASMPGLSDLLVDTAEHGALKVRRTDRDERTKSKLRILLKVSQILSAPDDIDVLLGNIIDLLLQIIEIDRAVLLLRNETTGEAEARVTRVIGGSVGSSPPYSRRIVQYVLRHNVAALFSDAAHDPRVADAQSVIAQTITASMCVPLPGRDRTLGVLYVDTLFGPRKFLEEDLEFLTAFASQAAVAIENASLAQRLQKEAATRMQAVMEAKLAALGTVVTGIAHELKNPLSFIKNFSELAQSVANECSETIVVYARDMPPAEAESLNESFGLLGEHLRKIGEHERRANAIIDGMLRHTRSAGNERELHDMNALVEESVRLARDEAERLSPGFSMDVETVYGDVGEAEMIRAYLGQALFQLAQNACDSMRKRRREQKEGYRPKLRVSTERDAQHITIRIRDNGGGIPHDVRARMFDPFFTTKPPGEGTGYGLSVCHDIVVQGHQGSLSVESEPGQFAEVIVKLPSGPAR